MNYLITKTNSKNGKHIDEQLSAENYLDAQNRVAKKNEKVKGEDKWIITQINI